MPDEPDIEIDPGLRPGVWANWVVLHRSPHEFTIDFARRDPEGPETGVLVARISFPASLMPQLKDSIDRAWQEYARKAMPPEVQDE